MLDQLFRRADELKKDYSAWHDRDPEFSKGEEDVPYLRLMLMVDPWQQEDPWLDLKTAELSAIFNQSPLMSSVPFDAVHTSGRGYLARQIGTNDPHSLGLTWQLRPSLNSDVIVPLRFSDGENGGSAGNFLKGYETAPRFLKMLRKRNYGSPRIVDLNMIYNLLIAIVELQRRILARADWSKPYYVKARLLNVWRTVPYLDIPEVLDQFNDHGLPMCMDSAVTSPLGREPDSFAEIPLLNDLDDADKIIWQAMAIFSHVVHPWGVPMLLDEDPGKFLKSLAAAGKASMSVQEGASGTPAES
jgi:hypothetical protein